MNYLNSWRFCEFVNLWILRISSGVPRAIFPQNMCRLRTQKFFSWARHGQFTCERNFLKWLFWFAERNFVFCTEVFQNLIRIIFWNSRISCKWQLFARDVLLYFLIFVLKRIFFWGFCRQFNFYMKIYATINPGTCFAGKKRATPPKLICGIVNFR